MDINFEEIYLHSHDPRRLFHFLSHLLDIEGEVIEEDQIKFKFKEIKFVILLSEKKRLDKTLYFSLSVDHERELADLKQNIEFYYYKEAQSKYSLTLEDNQLSFSDPDGRLWQVNLRFHSFHNASSNQNSHIDVRNC